MEKIEKLFSDDEFSYIYILPVEYLDINDVFFFGNVSIYPKGYFKLSKGFDNVYYDSNEQKEEVEGYLSEISNCVTIVVKDCSYSEYPGNIGSDKEILRKAINKTRGIVDFIRLRFCDVNDKKTMIGRVGQLKNGNTVLAMVSQHGLFSRIVKSDIYGNVLSSTKGVTIDDMTFLRDLSIFKPDINITGNVAIRSLHLFSNALENTGNTDKFIEFMRLFEFIAYPLTYEQFKKVRTKIAQHLVVNSYDETRLAEEFKLYTSGDNNDGYRTQIIHVGKQLEDILTDDEISSLLGRLQYYIIKCIDDLLTNYNKTWDELDSFRENKMRLARKNKSNEMFYLPSRSIVLVDYDFIINEIEESKVSYREIYKDKEFKNPGVYDIVYRCHENLRILNGGFEHDFIIYSCGFTCEKREIQFESGGRKFSGFIKTFVSEDEKYKVINHDSTVFFKDIQSEQSLIKNQIGFVMNDERLSSAIQDEISSERRTVSFIKNHNHSNITRVSYVNSGLVSGVLIGLKISEL